MLPHHAVLLFSMLLIVSVGRAQTPPDTVRSFQSFRTSVDSLEGPPLTSDHDITYALLRQSGGFLYDFNAFAWPNSWSLYGLNPHAVQLDFGPIPYDDLLTGRPRFDLLPTALLRNPQLTFGSPRGIFGVQTELRTIHANSPHTQLHYQTGDHKLQRITAIHAQQRKNPFQQSGLFQSLFGYGGASDAGDFPGSRLRRQRQLLMRTQYQRYSWSFEFLFLHHQRRLGAHSGVLGEDDRRYNRLIAQVRGQNHTRRDVRNDLLGTFKTHHITASLYLSTQTLRYEGVEGRSWRMGTSVYRDMGVSNHRIQARIDGYLQRLRGGSASPDGRASSFIGIQLTDSLKFDSGLIVALAGIQGLNGHWSPKAGLRAEARLSSLRPYIEVSYDACRNETQSWGRYLRAQHDNHGTLLHSNAGLPLHMGTMIISPYAFITRATNAVDYREVVIDSVEVIQDSHTALGAGIALDVRAKADRGIYGWVNAGYLQTGRTKYHGELVLPEWTLSGQIGFRGVLFTGDLHLDISLLGRSWSSLTSRTLHAPTGLLVLPSSDRRPIRGSYTLDLVVKGKIRTATVYLLYENFTSGTGLMAGNELVVDYPLPAAQMRFGVYWPIEN